MFSSKNKIEVSIDLVIGINQVWQVEYRKFPWRQVLYDKLGIG